MSSTHCQEVKPKSLTGSSGEDSNHSHSTSQEGSKTNEEDEASPDGEASGNGEGSDSGSSESEGSSSDSEITDVADPEEDHKGSSSEAEGLDAECGSSSLETDGEIPTRVATPMKKTKGGNPNSSQMLSLPDLNSKDTEEEQKIQRCKDAQLLDKNLDEWHDRMISEGHAEWKKCDTMICDHADPCKEAKFPDSTGLPLE